MSFDIVIRNGDTLPIVDKKLFLNNLPVDLTNYTIQFQVLNLDGTVVLNEAATLVSGGDHNEVQYQFDPDDFPLTPGSVYFAQFKATHASDTITFPNNRPISLFMATGTKYEYSYGGDPANRPIDAVRFLIQDTNLDKPYFTDSEILFLIDTEGEGYGAAIACANTLAAKYSGYARKSVGPLSVDYSSLAQQMYYLAEQLHKRRGRNSGAQVIMTQTQRDRIFSIGMHDNLSSDYTNITGNQAAT